MKQVAQNKQNERFSAHSGQAMLIAVLALGGAILGATTVAGLLTLYQIRATTDTANSAKAIFAADAGVEWALFDHYCTIIPPSGESRCPLVVSGTNDFAMPAFSNNASATVNCYESYDASGATTTCSGGTVVTAISNGVANGSERAFFLGIVGATTTYP
jgi:hypothetical protein